MLLREIIVAGSENDMQMAEILILGQVVYI
jgi:uncharacterized membrane protein (DUF373 family)